MLNNVRPKPLVNLDEISYIRVRSKALQVVGDNTNNGVKKYP